MKHLLSVLFIVVCLLGLTGNVGAQPIAEDLEESVEVAYAGPAELAEFAAELALGRVDALRLKKVVKVRQVKVRAVNVRAVRVVQRAAVVDVVHPVAAIRVRAIAPFTPTVFLPAFSAHASVGYGCGQVAAPAAPSADPLAVENAELRGELRALRSLIAQPK